MYYCHAFKCKDKEIVSIGGMTRSVCLIFHAFLLFSPIVHSVHHFLDRATFNFNYTAWLTNTKLYFRYKKADITWLRLILSRLNDNILNNL